VVRQQPVVAVHLLAPLLEALVPLDILIHTIFVLEHLLNVVSLNRVDLHQVFHKFFLRHRNLLKLLFFKTILALGNLLVQPMVLKRGGTAQHDVQNHPQTPQINGLVVPVHLLLLGQDDLGLEVVRRPTKGGHILARLVPRGLGGVLLGLLANRFLPLFPIQLTLQTKVLDFLHHIRGRLRVVQQDVFRLQIPVQNILPVQILQLGRNLHEDLLAFPLLVDPVIQQALEQVPPSQILGHKV